MNATVLTSEHHAVTVVCARYACVNECAGFRPDSLRDLGHAVTVHVTSMTLGLPQTRFSSPLSTPFNTTLFHFLIVHRVLLLS